MVTDLVPPMPSPLPVAQVVAYVRELSADVRGVAVLAADGSIHAEPAALGPPAAALAALLEHGWVRVPEGLALVARSAAGACVVVAAGPLALAGPTALDAAAALAAPVPGPIPDPSPPVREAARALLAAT